VIKGFRQLCLGEEHVCPWWFAYTFDNPLRLRDLFPGAELVFDGWTPFLVWAGNRHFSLSSSKFADLLRWGLQRGQELEGWGDGIRLLGEWGFFDQPEPRLDRIRWLRHIKSLTHRIYHFRLGNAAG
jgi:hypothetical protein